MVTYGKDVKEGRPLLKAHKLDYMKQKAISCRSPHIPAVYRSFRPSVGLRWHCNFALAVVEVLNPIGCIFREAEH